MIRRADVVWIQTNALSHAFFYKIIDAVRNCGIDTNSDVIQTGKQITKQDLYALGLSGRSNSAVLRKSVIQALKLPEHLSANGFLDVVNLLCTIDELQDIVDKI